MTSVRKLHDEAMSFAQMAMVARHQGEFERARQLALKACKLEADAAARIPIEMESEPTRSILFRSAATLAYQAKDFQVAEQLVFQGLSGYPPDDVAQELKDLYDQLNFEHHLKLRNVYLDDADVQMVLQQRGPGLSPLMQELGDIAAGAPHELIAALKIAQGCAMGEEWDELIEMIRPEWNE